MDISGLYLSSGCQRISVQEIAYLIFFDDHEVI